MRHFLDLDQLESKTIRQILDHAVIFKNASRPQSDLLLGKTLVLIFEKPSTRTRVSFEIGMKQLGGEVVVLGETDSQLGRGETIADTSRVLSRYADILMLRTNDHNKLLELAKHSSIPVINGLTDYSHPCQIMADILTFEQHRGPIEGKSIAWIGDGNNVATSWLHAAVKIGFELRIASPPELRVSENLVTWAHESGGLINIYDEAEEAAKNADCIVSDTWVSMGDDDEYTQRQELLASYQVDTSLMKQAKSDAIFMHCLPAHRGKEVTGDVIDGPQSVIWDEAENRLYTQKSILAWCLK